MRTLVLSISGWCFSSGAVLSMRSSGHIGPRCFYQPANTGTREGAAKVISQPWACSSWEVVIEGRCLEQRQAETAFTAALQGKENKFDQI